MNRMFLLALVSALLVYLALYFYDSSNDPRLYTVISAGLALGFIFGCVHMLIDRKFHDWTPTALAIVYIVTSMAALFGFLYWQREYGRMEPGVQQGWIDVVVATAIIGLPLWFLSIGRYRWEKWHGTNTVRPSDQVTPGWKDGDPDRRHTYRRAEDRALRGIQ